MNSYFKHGFLGLAFFVLLACDDTQKDTHHDPHHMHFAEGTVRVGVLLGSAEEELLEKAKKIAAQTYDMHIIIVPYRYMSEINQSLSDHKIDANFFQYPAYLDYSEKKYGYHLVSMGETYVYPMGVYSKKIHNILELHQRSSIAIPNEPTNEARALFLLEKAGLIRMKSDTNMIATTNDILSNPHDFEFKKLSSDEILDALPNVDIALINAGFALTAGLTPSKDALVIENINANYANVLVTREDEKDQLQLKALIEILRSPAVSNVANEIFKGDAIPAWK